MPLGTLGLLLIPLGLAGPLLRADGARASRSSSRWRRLVADLPGAALDVRATAARGPDRRRRRAGSGCASGAHRGAGRPLGHRARRRLDAAGGAAGRSGRRARPDRGRAPRRRPGWRSRHGSATAGLWTAGCRPQGQKRRRPGRRLRLPAATDLRCDARGCIVSRQGQLIALSAGRRRSRRTARWQSLAISYPRIEGGPNGTPLIGRPARRDARVASRSGSSAAAIEALTVREVRGDAPGSRRTARPPPRHAASLAAPYPGRGGHPARAVRARLDTGRTPAQTGRPYPPRRRPAPRCALSPRPRRGPARGQSRLDLLRGRRAELVPAPRKQALDEILERPSLPSSGTRRAWPSATTER